MTLGPTHRPWHSNLDFKSILQRGLMRGLALGMAAAVLVSVGACNLLTPLVFVGDHKKKILAEFDKLPESKVVILVWVDAATLFDYPHARFELAAYISDKLQTEMTHRKQGIEIVDPRDVEDHLQARAEARINPQAVGTHFDADFVVFVEVLAFQVRDPQQPQFVQGRIEAGVAVQDIRAERGRGQRYDLIAVQAKYPQDNPVLMSGTNTPLVREATYRRFAEEVARKFYDYTVDLL
jgi:hypothetical protein